jgi:hypothetical protein
MQHIFEHSNMIRRLVPALSKEFSLLWILLTLLPSVHHAFTISSRVARHEQQRSYSTVQYNFWKGLFDSAFENDPSLSTVDQRKGMLEGPNSSDNDVNTRVPLTDVQRAWRERQMQSSSSSSSANAPLIASLLPNSLVTLDFYLVGVPSKDPSNDLYGSRVNISNRNKELGLDLPSEPNGGSIDLRFLPDGRCQCTSVESPFADATQDGQWKLSDDGTQLRFSLYSLGYSRTIQTKGSIERVFWSDQPEVTRQTSSQYSIPPGWVYGDIKIKISTSRPGTLDLKSGGCGVLRVEQAVGLLGAASKLVACGTFDAKVKYDDSTTPSTTGSTTASRQQPSPGATGTPNGGTL